MDSSRELKSIAGKIVKVKVSDLVPGDRVYDPYDEAPGPETYDTVIGVSEVPDEHAKTFRPAVTVYIMSCGVDRTTFSCCTHFLSEDAWVFR